MKLNEGHYYILSCFIRSSGSVQWDTVTSLAKASLTQQYLAFP